MTVFFALLGSARVKAARKMLVKLTPDFTVEMIFLIASGSVILRKNLDKLDVFMDVTHELQPPCFGRRDYQGARVLSLLSSILLLRIVNFIK